MSNEQLVSYLDGELLQSERAEVEQLIASDPAVRLRLELFNRGDRRFKEVFRPLLSRAPIEKLQASLASARAKTRSQGALERPNRYLIMGIAAAFMLIIILGGVIAGYFIGAKTSPTGMSTSERADPALKPRGWREALADYHALLSPETFSAALRDVDAQTRALELAGRTLGLRLTVERISAAALDFQRTEILQLKTMPVVQLDYLTKTGIPLSFSIVKSGEASRPPALEKHRGLNIVHWVMGGYGFMLVSRIPEAQLKAIAKGMQRRFF